MGQRVGCAHGSEDLPCAACPVCLGQVTEPLSSKDPLHGVTLEKLLVDLVEELGWRGLADRVPVRCFMFDPSVKSSLKFLRKTPWARAKVEAIWTEMKACS